jgi:hypothetical protein
MPSIRKRKRSQEELTDQPQRRRDCFFSYHQLHHPAFGTRPEFHHCGSNGQREHTGSTCNLEEVISKQAPQGMLMQPRSKEPKKLQRDDQRHCCCDECCQACTSDAPCKLHDGFDCDGCANWFQAACAGWETRGNPPCRRAESKMCPNFKTPLGSLLQADSSLSGRCSCLPSASGSSRLAPPKRRPAGSLSVSPSGAAPSPSLTPSLTCQAFSRQLMRA